MAEKRLTAEGVAKLEQQLEYLKTVRVLEIAEEIKVARAFGDLSENAEYDAAKAEQAKVEYEIAELEATLRDAVVIDEESIDSKTANIGTTVRIKNLVNGKEFTFHLVGTAEADIIKGKISCERPPEGSAVGFALCGHKKGETVEVETPIGKVAYKILEIRLSK